jgi:hypothetical protein
VTPSGRPPEGPALRELLAATRETLRAAGGDPIALAAAIRGYLVRGRELGVSPHELRHHFDISSPSLPEQAGLSVAQQRLASGVFHRVADELFASSRPSSPVTRKRAVAWLLAADVVVAAVVGALAGWELAVVALIALPVAAVVLFALLGPYGDPPPHQEDMLRNPDRAQRR